MKMEIEVRPEIAAFLKALTIFTKNEGGLSKILSQLVEVGLEGCLSTVTGGDQILFSAHELAKAYHLTDIIDVDPAT